MEYNYKELFPILESCKDGIDEQYRDSYRTRRNNFYAYLTGDTEDGTGPHEEYVRSAERAMEKERLATPEPQTDGSGEITRAQWDTYKRNLNSAAFTAWAIADTELNSLDEHTDGFPDESIVEGSISWGPETYEYEVNYWSCARDDVSSLKDKPEEAPTHHSRYQNKDITSGLAALFQPLAEYCSLLDKAASVGDALLSLIPSAAVLAVSLWLLQIGQNAEFGDGFIPTILNILFLPLLVVAVISGILLLIGVIGLLKVPGEKRANRRRRKKLAEQIEENRDAIQRRLAYYHLWIDSGLLSEEGKKRAQKTVDTLEEWVSRYEADRVGQKS